MAKNKVKGYYTYFYDDSMKASKKRKTVVNAAPIEDPSVIDPGTRARYFRNNLYPYLNRMTYEEYYDRKFPLQVELVKLQDWVNATGERVIILFEGRDAAGKGGTIRRFMEHWNPRGARVVALQKPSDVQTGQWYFQRYIEHFPTAGEIVLFDRSWYNRAGVERVMGFATEEEYRRFIMQTPALERMIVQEGIRFIKLYFSVSKKEQKRRFKQRQKDALKKWKMSPIDMQSAANWDNYTREKKAMFYYTHTREAPWTLIKSDDKMRARINAMRHVVHNMPYPGKDENIACAPDPWIVASVDDVYETLERGSPNGIAVDMGEPDLAAAASSAGA